MNYVLPSITYRCCSSISYTTSISFINLISTNPESLNIITVLTDFTQVGTHVVGLTLIGALADSSEYLMNVIVTNSAPVFTTAPPSVSLYKG